jgi:hypothetical protein
MMHFLLKSTIYLAVIALSTNALSAKEWRGIVPLVSTRSQTEKLLGLPRQNSQWFSYYNLPNEIVVLRFQSAPCDSFGLGWNVPAGTVVGIGVIPKGIHRKEEYFGNNDFKLDEHNAGFIYYSDEATGFEIETYKDVVTLVDYYPRVSDERLRCPRIQECCFDVFPRFDEYQKLSFADEKARLDNFVIQMNQRMGRGVLEVVGPTSKIRAHRMKLAARAKAYLARERALESERLLVVDGGYGPDTLTRLSIYSIGGLASRIYLFPEKDPENTAPNKRLERTRRE